jgi:hypothetical protein
MAHHVVPVAVGEHDRGGAAELADPRDDRVELARKVRGVDDDAAASARQDGRVGLPDPAGQDVELHAASIRRAQFLRPIDHALARLAHTPVMDAPTPTVFDWLLAFCEREQWEFESAPDHRTVRAVFAGKSGTWTTYVRAFDAEHQIAVYGVLPFAFDENQRPGAAELITRINYRLVIGNFEMDWDDGGTRYKTSIDFEGSALTDNLMLQLVRANLAVVNSYLPAFAGLAQQGLTASEALALVG